MAAPDSLSNIRSAFYLGAYSVVTRFNGEEPNFHQEDAIQRKCLYYRSCIAIGFYEYVIGSIAFSAATSLQAVKLFALYHQAPENKEAQISCLKEWLEDSVTGSDPTLRLIAGIIFMHDQDYAEALKHTNAGGTMELHALNVQIYLKMCRSDCAEKQLEIMQQIDEDHTLTRLANAWFNLAVGGSKIQEAYIIYQDFSEIFAMTGLVLNGKAVCCMHMGNFDEAESLLLDALTKDAKDPEILANLAVCSLHLGKPSSGYLSQLMLSHPDHMLVKRVSSAEVSFDRAVQGFKQYLEDDVSIKI